ncbi:TadE/TadG family type IV pilus assembly protein [Halovulum marinum]|nr:TadE family protein [Halovulum marinum]
MATMKQLLRRFFRDRRGASTVEFVIIFPAVIVLVFSVIESGFLMTRYMMLDRGVDIAVRDLRLGRIDDPVNHDKIRQRICTYARILKDCDTTLIVELVPAASAPADFPHNAANCLDRSGTVAPVLSADDGGRGDIMYLRACALTEPIVPGLGLGLMLPKDATGAHRMITYTAFMNEPV